ncbi:MAG: cysteine--tRNA ligase [Candidatus Shikimatogenerans bostrichidophilus]|nr:MAG: cysteine--tRNA ligase [Candidatus Shikimatogenerans bostrichidophilus]
MKEIIYKAKKEIYIYNTLKRTKELFIPINKNKIGMYVCGPTLYKKIHLGNCRTFIFFDVLYRYFKHLNFNIKYIRNITDINYSFNNSFNNKYYSYFYKIKTYYSKFNKVLNIFNLLSPSLEPRTTSHIIEQINNIKKILKLKFAYKKNGSIYFNIEKYNKYIGNYGKILNNINIYNQFEKTNSFSKDKKNNLDFVLWKKLKNINIIKWKSLWSTGIPGWHIGCTTISNKYLGSYFDIHGGGVDLKLPHHECEIAQSNVINNKKKNLAKYWIHTNMLTINNKKMSKSLNNLILPYDIIKGKFKLTKNYKINPFILKLYLLQTHYRKPINFSLKSIKNSIKNYINLLNIFKKIKKIHPKKTSSSNINIKYYFNLCYKSMNDDFNIPLLIYNLIKINKIIDKCLNNVLKISFYDLKKIKKLMKIFLIDILGLKIFSIKLSKIKIKVLINKILKIRNEMRKKKLYLYSDKIRDILKNYVSIKDK